MEITKQVQVKVEIDTNDVLSALEKADIVTLVFLLKRMVMLISGHEKLAELREFAEPSFSDFVKDLAKFVKESGCKVE